MKIFVGPKNSKRSWTEQYLYLVAVSEACGGADNLLLENIVRYAEPAMRISMLLRLSLTPTEKLRQDEELAHFAQSTEVGTQGKQLGRELVNMVKNGRPNERTCYKCRKTGHIKATCPEEKGRTARQDTDLFLTFKASTV